MKVKQGNFIFQALSTTCWKTSGSFFVALLLALVLSAQAPQFHWAVSTPPMNMGGANSITKSVVFKPNGNPVFCGHFTGQTDLDNGPGTILLDGGTGDTYIMEKDSNGNTLSAFELNHGLGNASPIKHFIDDHGNYLVVGVMTGTGIDFDAGNLSPIYNTNGQHYIFFVGLGPTGTFRWVQAIVANWSMIPDQVQQDGFGNLYIAGTLSGGANVDPYGSNLVYSLGGLPDGFVLKMDSLAHFQWINQFPSGGYNGCEDIAVDASGESWALGDYNGSSPDLDPGPGTVIFNSPGYAGNFLVHYASNGSLLQALNLGGTGSVQGSDIALDPNGNLFVSGRFSGTFDADPGPGTRLLTAQGNQDIFLLKLDALGHHKWSFVLNGSLYNGSHELASDDNGHAWMQGNFAATLDFDPGAGVSSLTPIGSADGYLAHYDSAGHFIWVGQFPGSGLEDHFLTVGGDHLLYHGGSFWNNSITDADPGPGTYNLPFGGSGNTNGFMSRLVRCTSASTSNIAVTACDAYLSPSGHHTWTTSGQYVDSLISHAGCDSILTIQLTMRASSAPSPPQIVSQCGSYLWFGQNYTASGLYSHTLTNTAGCDSMLRLQLTVLPSSTHTLQVNACGSYTLNNQTYLSSGTYTQLLTNALGCDSILTLALTMNPVLGPTIAVTQCGPYVWQGNTYAASGIYHDTLVASLGCDSILTLDLDVLQASTSSLSVTACDSATVNGQTYFSSGLYTQTLMNALGCDSVLNIDLTLSPTTAGSLTVTACDSFSVNGHSYFSSGLYTQTLTNALGCDSLLSIHLQISSLNAMVTVQGDTLWAAQSGGSYQWLDCGQGNTAIPGATGQYFVPNASGNYAVAIGMPPCTDTSDCVNSTVVGLRVQQGWDIRIFPNPTDGECWLSLPDVISEGWTLRIWNALGQSLGQQTLAGDALVALRLPGTGVYWVSVQDADGRLMWMGEVLRLEK